MKSLLAILLAISVTWGSPRISAKCVEVEPESPIGQVTALHTAGAELAIGLVCNGDERCIQKHGPRLTRAAHTVVDVCLAEPLVPKWMCLGFVANLSNESAGLEHPTCGGLDQACVVECDRLPVGGARQGCFLDCARDQGIYRGGARWNRVRRCNDWGTSRGPFQQKRSTVRYCKKLLKDPNYDPHNLAQSARCMVKKIKRSALSKRWPCRRNDGNRWAIAMKRVGRGPLVTVEEASPRTWVPGTRIGEGRWLPAKEAVRVQRCEESQYARWGMTRYQMCGKPCREVPRPTTEELQPANPTIQGKDRVLSQGD